jgi:hypothetical protein
MSCRQDRPMRTRKLSTYFIGAFLLLLLKLLFAAFGLGAILVVAVVAFAIWLVCRRRR